jgi:hypothetical protein
MGVGNGSGVATRGRNSATRAAGRHAIVDDANKDGGVHKGGAMLERFLAAGTRYPVDAPT